MFWFNRDVANCLPRGFGLPWNASAGNRFLFTIAGQTLGGRVEGTGTWDNYRTVKIGRIALSAGPTSATFRSDGPIRNALIDVRSIRLLPVSQ